MSLTLPVAREIYNACNPDESLGPDDPRNVDLDASGDDGLVRGESWARRLATKVAVANKPTCVLFTGLPGSGKSTELRRFAKIVEDEQRYLVVIADALELLDLSAEIDVPDILMVMLYRAEQAVLTLEGRSGKDALKDSPMKRLWQWMDRTDIQLKEGEVGFGPDEASTKLVFEMKTRETVRQRIRRHLAANLSAFIEEVRREFLRLEGRAKKAGREGMVLVLDSLEKLQGTSTSWEKVLESAERVFSSNASYLRLPVHTLYTIPPALSMRLRVDVEFLPMVKLRTREGRRHEAGYAAMRRLIEQRVKAAHLNELLGPTTLDARVEEVIASSGGYPRELMRLLQALVESAMTRGVGFDQPTFERVLERSRDTYRRLVRASGALPWLRKVRETQRLSADSAEELSAAADMLRDNVVLRYLNDAEWYELHPAVRDMEELR